MYSYKVIGMDSNVLGSPKYCIANIITGIEQWVSRSRLINLIGQGLVTNAMYVRGSVIATSDILDSFTMIQAVMGEELENLKPYTYANIMGTYKSGHVGVRFYSPNGVNGGFFKDILEREGIPYDDKNDVYIVKGSMSREKEVCQEVISALNMGLSKLAVSHRFSKNIRPIDYSVCNK